MKKTTLIAVMTVLGSGVAFAQPDKEGRNTAFFLWDYTKGTFGFHLPEGALYNDKISIRNDKDVEIRSEHVTPDMLRSGQYTLLINSLQAGDYTIALSRHNQLLHSFKFSNKEQYATEKAKGINTDNKAAAHPSSFSFNPNGGIFTVGTGEQMPAGTRLEVFNDQNKLIAQTEVSNEMISMKQYTIKAGQLENGAYSLNIGGRRFGRISVSQ